MHETQTVTCSLQKLKDLTVKETRYWGALLSVWKTYRGKWRKLEDNASKCLLPSPLKNTIFHSLGISNRLWTEGNTIFEQVEWVRSYFIARRTGDKDSCMITYTRRKLQQTWRKILSALSALITLMCNRKVTNMMHGYYKWYTPVTTSTNFMP